MVENTKIKILLQNWNQFSGCPSGLSKFLIIQAIIIADSTKM